MVETPGKSVLKILREWVKSQMSHRMDEIKPAHHVTKEECQEMIDAAIRRHNRNASIISFCVGWVVLALFSEGLLRLIGVIPPIFPWLHITLN